MLGLIPMMSVGMNSGCAVQDHYSVSVESPAEPEQDNTFLVVGKNIHTFSFDIPNAFSFATNECYDGDAAVELQSPPPEID